MAIGVIGIQTNQKKRQNGPPFTAASAENGLSVDAVTGAIVLGNDAGAPGNPAQLLNTREIFGNGFNIRQRDSATEFTNYNAGSLFLQNQVVNIASITIGPPLVTIAAAGGDVPAYNLDDNTSTVEIGLNGAGLGTIIGNGNRLATYNPTSVLWQFGPLVGFSNATMQVAGTFSYRALVRGPIAGALALNRDVDSGEIFTNSAALTLTIPVMTGANLRSGYIVGAAVLNAGGIVLQLDATQTGFFGAAATTAGGTYQSVTPGSTIKIVLVDANTFVTESFTGTWVLT